jgi:Skp1 family, tetramerisation domain
LHLIHLLTVPVSFLRHCVSIFPLPKISKEGKPFPVPLAVATMSELIKSMKDDEEDDDDEDSKPTEVPLPNVKSEVLEKVIEFCEHHLVSPAWPKQRSNVAALSLTARLVLTPFSFLFEPFFL